MNIEVTGDMNVNSGVAFTGNRFKRKHPLKYQLKFKKGYICFQPMSKYHAFFRAMHFGTRRFRYWIPSSFSGRTYSGASNRKSFTNPLRTAYNSGGSLFSGFPNSPHAKAQHQKPLLNNGCLCFGGCWRWQRLALFIGFPWVGSNWMRR
jgi:hypothetical protein